MIYQWIMQWMTLWGNTTHKLYLLIQKIWRSFPGEYADLRKLLVLLSTLKYLVNSYSKRLILSLERGGYSIPWHPPPYIHAWTWPYLILTLYPGLFHRPYLPVLLLWSVLTFVILMTSKLKTLEWWILRSMLDLLFFLICRLNKACSPLLPNLLMK